MPTTNDIDCRDRAVVALLILTGTRDGALIGLRMKHIDTVEKWVWQNPREEVQTKFGKAIRSYFFASFPEAEAVLTDWVSFQRQNLLRGDDDPLLPKTEVGIGTSRRFEAMGFMREGAPVEEFRAASQNLGHSSMLTTLGSYGQLPKNSRRELILRKG